MISLICGRIDSKDIHKYKLITHTNMFKIVGLSEGTMRRRERKRE
jgi:hypothetical protein